MGSMQKKYSSSFQTRTEKVAMQQQNDILGGQDNADH
jgi:hypothetical protein